MDEAKKEEKIEELKQRRLQAVRLLGKYDRYIIKELLPDMRNHRGKTMMVSAIRSEKNKLGIPIATHRLRHYYNTYFISMAIARGLFPNDEELIKGIGVVALYHDIGQTPFGHDGEDALINASKEWNGGARLHNIDGAIKILFRKKERIQEAIKRGIVKENIKKEAEKKGISYSELRERYENNLETPLKLKIGRLILENNSLLDEAVWVIATSAGNHNGERGSAQIKPNFEITNGEFYERAMRTYFCQKREDYKEADRQMEACSIVDAIVKISDQISSIPFDIIDGKRAGIENEIFEGWAEPISQVLGISLEEAKQILKGNNNDLTNMVKELQNRLVESVIRCSSQDEIDMDLGDLMYGIIDRKTGQYILNGLRTFNPGEHQSYTSTRKCEEIVNHTISRLVDTLTESILTEDGIFPPDLNELFKSTTGRKQKMEMLREKFDKDEAYKGFYEYVMELSREEYKMHRKIVRYMEVDYFRDRIEKVLKVQEGLRDGTIGRSRGDVEMYAIEAYVLSPEYRAMEKDENGNYSDDEIGYMIRRINEYLNTNPIEDLEGKEIKHLSIFSKKREYKRDSKTRKLILDPTTGDPISYHPKINTDQQIAARIAISYIADLSDSQVVELASKLGILSKENRREIEMPYTELNPKARDLRHQTNSVINSQEDYLVGASGIPRPKGGEEH